MNTSASLALVIHNFRPLNTYASPSSRARVWSAKASLPDAASDKAYAPTLAEASRGSHRACSSGVPQRSSALITSVFQNIRPNAARSKTSR